MDSFDFKPADDAPLADEKHDKWIDVLNIDWGAQDAAIDDFATESGETQVALLLPAVQQAREAARRSQSGDDEAEDSITVDYGALDGF